MIYQTIPLPPPFHEGDAALTLYLQDTPPRFAAQQRPAVVICPGGGYAGVSDREGEPIALAFAALGYQAAVVHYAVAPARFPTALHQLAFTFALLRRRAGEWHINPRRMAVAGFSAGGHLAASLGCFWQRPSLARAVGEQAEAFRPNAMVLGYPVITAGAYANKGSFENLLGEAAADPAALAAQSLEQAVTPGTPPAFLWHTADDAVVPVENSLLFFGALRRQGVAAELHVYPHGPHGLALANGQTAVNDSNLCIPACENWLSLACTFLENEMG